MASQIETLSGCAFLAFPEMEELLREELKGRYGIDTPQRRAGHEGEKTVFRRGRAQWIGPFLYLPSFPVRDDLTPASLPALPYWSRTTLRTPFLLTFDSAGDAARALMGIQRNWASSPFQLWRRTELIEKKLPFIPTKPRSFPTEFPTTPMGIFTLVDSNHILASALTSSDLACGILAYEEDHVRPPSRAYLKLQESLAWAHHLLNIPYPGAGERCFDAGACPGGWTWVLRQCGADVFAVDRSELRRDLMEDPHITFRAHDAFTLEPSSLGRFDWIVSDVICYPERLLPWIKGWIDSGLVRNMICTIKLQGEINWREIEAFASIPRSRVLHLNYNKHELTFIHAGEA